MKCHIRLGNLRYIITVEYAAEFLFLLFKCGYSVFINPSACKLHRKHLQRFPDLEYIQHALFGHPGNLGALARDHKNETFKLKLPDCLADRRSAYAQLIRKLNLHQALARLKLPPQDRLPQGIENDISKREISVHLNIIVCIHIMPPLHITLYSYDYVHSSGKPASRCRNPRWHA